MKNQFYKTQEGKVHRILDYDEINKMICIEHPQNTLMNQWVHDTEYNTWVLCDAQGNPIENNNDEEIMVDDEF